MKALIFAPLLLVACAGLEGFTVAQEVAVACRGYASTLSAVTPFKNRMSAAEKTIVDEANALVIPACNSVALGAPPSDDMLRVLRDHLRKMLVLEQSVKSAGA